MGASGSSHPAGGGEAGDAAAAGAEGGDDEGELIVESDAEGRAVALWPVRRALGAGAFARVYEVSCAATGESLACKVISQEALAVPQGSSLTAKDPRASLEREIRIHSMLEHENVVRLHRYWEDEQFVYVLLELVEGQTLLDLVRSRGRFPAEEVAYLLHRILDAVRFLHETCNIVHRDLKLSNVMLTKQAEVKVLDFGFARELDRSTFERCQTACGTPNYIAPEVLEMGTPSPERGGYSFEIDLWSVGVMAFALFTGGAPFATDSLRATYRRIRDVSYTWPDDMKATVAPESVSLVASLLQADPALRPTLAELDESAFFSRFPRSAVAPALLAAAARGEPAPVPLTRPPGSPTSAPVSTTGPRPPRALSPRGSGGRAGPPARAPPVAPGAAPVAPGPRAPLPSPPGPRPRRPPPSPAGGRGSCAGSSQLHFAPGSAGSSQLHFAPGSCAGSSQLHFAPSPPMPTPRTDLPAARRPPLASLIDRREVQWRERQHQRRRRQQQLQKRARAHSCAQPAPAAGGRSPSQRSGTSAKQSSASRSVPQKRSASQSPARTGECTQSPTPTWAARIRVTAAQRAPTTRSPTPRTAAGSFPPSRGTSGAYPRWRWVSRSPEQQSSPAARRPSAVARTTASSFPPSRGPAPGSRAASASGTCGSPATPVRRHLPPARRHTYAPTAVRRLHR